MSNNEIANEVRFEQDTREHVKQVQKNIFLVIKELLDRAAKHDDSKFLPPERELFIEYTPKLAGLTYGSPEYKQALESLKPALIHHYAKNDHHSEHYKNGINDMHLIALLELYCDWYAATKRHHDGNIRKSIEINRERYGISDQLVRIFENTATWFEAQK